MRQQFSCVFHGEPQRDADLFNGKAGMNHIGDHRLPPFSKASLPPFGETFLPTLGKALLTSRSKALLTSLGKALLPPLGKALLPSLGMPLKYPLAENLSTPTVNAFFQHVIHLLQVGKLRDILMKKARPTQHHPR